LASWLAMIMFLRPVLSQNVITDWWDQFAYYFGWGMTEMGHFNDRVCQIDPQTFHFGGLGLESKWIMGGSVVQAITSGPSGTANAIKGLFGQNALDKLTVEEAMAMKKEGSLNYVGLGSTEYRYFREEQLALMIGSDYMEPCFWRETTPKIIEYNIQTDLSNPTRRGQFDFYIVAGVKCGAGRFSEWLQNHPKPDDASQLERWEESFHEYIGNGLQDYQTRAKLDSTLNPPLASFDSAGVLEGATGDQNYGYGRFYTSALFDPSVAKQGVCGIFHCNREGMMSCAVRVDTFRVSDIAGQLLDSDPEGTVLFGLSHMDLFTLLMAVVCVLFFFVQCLCCCHICVMEMNAGVVDEAAILEANLKEKYKKRSVGDRGNSIRKRRESRRNRRTRSSYMRRY